jgi:hypothetical protein
MSFVQYDYWVLLQIRIWKAFTKKNAIRDVSIKQMKFKSKNWAHGYSHIGQKHQAESPYRVQLCNYSLTLKILAITLKLIIKSKFKTWCSVHFTLPMQRTSTSLWSTSNKSDKTLTGDKLKCKKMFLRLTLCMFSLKFCPQIELRTLLWNNK